jgi:hypothetical protein
VARDEFLGASETAMPQDVVNLFHRLNNQLGVILANSELLENKLQDETSPGPSRASRHWRTRSDWHRPEPQTRGWSWCKRQLQGWTLTSH